MLLQEGFKDAWGLSTRPNVNFWAAVRISTKKRQVTNAQSGCAWTEASGTGLG